MIIDNVDFENFEVQRYWSFPKNYKKDPREETRNMIFSGDYIGSRKMDGAMYRLVKDIEGNCKLLGRSKSVNGEYLNKIDWVPHLHDYFNSLPIGTVLLGEIYFPNNEGSKNVTTIMGCLVDKAVARQEKGNKLHYYVFDILAIYGKSLLNKGIEARILYLDMLKSHEYVEYAKYYEGGELWTQLQTILAAGGEGMVITKTETLYAPGKRTARQTLKIKKELQETIDCFFTGVVSPPTRLYNGKEIETWTYWENIRTNEKIEGEFYSDYQAGVAIEPVTRSYFNDWAGSLEIGVMNNGEVMPIGMISGLSMEIRSNPKKYKGIPLEVTCMEIMYDSYGDFSGLRHAKALRFRPDLSIEDCTLEKFINK